jgi:hypothetical protein
MQRDLMKDGAIPPIVLVPLLINGGLNGRMQCRRGVDSRGVAQ